MGTIERGYLMPHPPIIVPEVGGKSRLPAQRTIEAMERVAEEIAALKPQTIIITSPHGQGFRDFFYLPDHETMDGDFAAFGAPQTAFQFRSDNGLQQELQEECEQEELFGGFLSRAEQKRYGLDARLDHGALVPLYFICRAWCDFSILYIPMPMGRPAHMVRFGELIGRVVRRSDRRTVFVASGDLSHCLKTSAPAGYSPKGARYDRKLVGIVRDLDEEALLDIGEEDMREAAECGTRSFACLWGALHDRTMQSEVYSYEGPFGVGYLVAMLDQVPEGGRHR